MNTQWTSRAGVQRATEITITAMFWAIWLYLVMPLVSLLLWLAGINLFVEEMIVRGGYEALLGELSHYGLVALGISVAISLWVGWNRQYYGRHNLRTRQPSPVNQTELASYAGLPEDELQTLHAGRKLRVTFDQRDRLVMLSTGKDGLASDPESRV